MVFREFYIADSRKAVLIFIEGLVDQNQINQFVLHVLMSSQKVSFDFEKIVEQLSMKEIPVSQVAVESDAEKCVLQVLTGNCLLLLSGEEKGILFGLVKFEQRSITEPTSEPVIRGPKEGFTENIRINTSLIRRRI